MSIKTLALIEVEPARHRDTLLIWPSRGLCQVPEWDPTAGGCELHTLRLDSAMTLRAMARALGCDRYVVSGLECGRLTLSAEHWERLLHMAELAVADQAEARG